MKKLLFILLLSPFLLIGQTPTDPGLYEVIYLTIKTGQEKAFETAVKKHNQAFHKEGSLYNASVYYNITGPVGGTYAWIMGPTYFGAMDDRPADDAHDEDWKNVNKYVESASAGTYWQEDPKLTSPGPDVRTSKSLVWIIDLKTDKMDRWKELVAQITEVYKTKRPNESLYVYTNRFKDTRAGQDVAVVFTFDKYGWLDREDNMDEQFEAVHGEGSWSHFLEEYNACIEGRFDILRERVK